MNNLEQHLARLFLELDIPEKGRQLVLSVVNGEPVRQVQGRYGNTVVVMPSQKMNRQLMLESRTGEAARAVEFEEDDDVLAHVWQPCTSDIIAKDSDGRVFGRWSYTPDCMVIRRSRIDIIEVKDEAQLIANSIKSDHWFKDDKHQWHYAPAEEHFGALGLHYEVLSNITIPAILINNMRFLADYAHPDCPPLDEAIKHELIKCLRHHRMVSLHDLINEFQFSSDAIFQSVLAKHIYVDINRTRLDASSELMIYSDQPTGDAHRIAMRAQLEPVLPLPGRMHIASGTTVTFDGTSYVVVLCGETEASLRDIDGHIRVVPLASLKHLHNNAVLSSDCPVPARDERRTLAHISPQELQRAIDRRELLLASDGKKYGSRTLSRYAAATKLATDGMEVILALVDNFRNRGNREHRLPNIVEELAARAIGDKYNQPEKPPKKAAYAVYVSYCVQHSLDSTVQVVPMSYPTFCRRCDEKENIRSREGKRAAYQKAPIPLFMDQSFPVHGVRGHEILLIDHTIVTLATCSPDGVALGKPTYTLATDAHTTQARAFIISYDPPSAKLVLLVLRDYVRRHGRLPRVLVVDNGKEFHSRELKFFCNLYGIELRYRPSGRSRGGAQIERALGGTEMEVLAALEGNTRQMRDPRLVTKSIDPFRRAVWTLKALWGAFEDYLFSAKPDRIHPALGMTPNEYEQKRVQETGRREHTFIRFDENIMLMTSPHSTRVHHVVDKQRGIYVTGAMYWHPSFAKMRKGTKVEVRVEPWDVSVVYAQVNREWVVAIIRDQRRFVGVTRRSVDVALREQKKLAKRLSNADTLSQDQLLRKQRLWLPEFFDPRIQAQEKEMLYCLESMDMGVALKQHRPDSLNAPLDSTVVSPIKPKSPSDAVVAEPMIKEGDTPEAALNADFSPQKIPSSPDNDAHFMVRTNTRLLGVFDDLL